MKENCELTVVMPALNEEKNILLALKNTLKALEKLGVSSEIIVINDGSRDKTEELVKGFMQKEKGIRMVHHDNPQGIGASFWDGVDNAEGGAIVLLPGDNENNPWEIFRYFRLLEHVDIVIPFVYNREARSILRNALSSVYHFIVNSTFLVNFNYTNGTILYRKPILNELNFRSKGFFFQTDILVRAVKKGYLFAEVPYRLGHRNCGVSKSITFASFLKVAKDYLSLVKDAYFNKDIKNSKGKFNKDSQSAKRWKE
jgi:glycosyltransferase involved in cell wall biosynthesis